MACELDQFGAVQVWACGNKLPPCTSCGAASRCGCSAELRGPKAGQSCGRALCARCNEGTASAPLCGAHARIARAR